MLQHFQKILRSIDLFADVFKMRNISKQKIVIDFSSPNIAKTFHIGNLRSTVYGNFIQKLYRSAGHDVYSINYLGDWGTQFAILALYWELMDKKKIEKPSLNIWNKWSTRQKVEYLTKCYADANQYIKSNENLINRARKLFSDMEQIIRKQNTLEKKTSLKSSLLNDFYEVPEFNAIKLWIEWRELSIQYLQQFYVRFNVTHNETCFESDQVEGAHLLINKLIDNKIAFLTADKLWAIRDNYISGKVVIKKSDDSSLYLSRDLSAIIDRDKKFNADKYLYVVDRSQYRHFTHLKSLLEALNLSELAAKISHIQYGRIIGLSTRYNMYSRLGKNESVDYLIQEGVAEAKRYIMSSPTTRINLDDKERVNDTLNKLAQSVIVFDLMRRHRNTEYTFTFKNAFALKNNHALLLNEKYSRLCSMEKINYELMEHINKLNNTDCNSLSRLTFEISNDAQNLARLLYEFDSIVLTTYDQLEPCVLVSYLVKLAHQIGKSMAALKVRGEVEKKALPRLFLFCAAKKVLEEGMKMLGIQIVEEL